MDHSVLKPHLPLESVARERLATRQIDFARAAAEVLRGSEDIHYEACGTGIRTLAASEESLASATLALRRLYGDRVDLEAPAVRLLPGPPVRQPMMALRISLRTEYCAVVRRELRARRVQVIEERFGSRMFVIRATAPLASLMGLPGRLAALTHGTSVHWIRLTHYASVEDDGLEAPASA